MVKKISTELELQNECFSKVCADLSESLTKSNTERCGAAFKELTYAGRIIVPLDNIDIYIAKEIDRLQSGGSDLDHAAIEASLLQLLATKAALELYSDEVKRIAKEERKRQATEQVTKVAITDGIKKARRIREIKGHEVFTHAATPTKEEKDCVTPLEVMEVAERETAEQTMKSARAIAQTMRDAVVSGDVAPLKAALNKAEGVIDPLSDEEIAKRWPDSKLVNKKKDEEPTL